jgi:2-keto-3-deoxy-L-rhamnonate aldolase RhmA
MNYLHTIFDQLRATTHYSWQPVIRPTQGVKFNL